MVYKTVKVSVFLFSFLVNIIGTLYIRKITTENYYIPNQILFSISLVTRTTLIVKNMPHFAFCTRVRQKGGVFVYDVMPNTSDTKVRTQFGKPHSA